MEFSSHSLFARAGVIAMAKPGPRGGAERREGLKTLPYDGAGASHCADCRCLTTGYGGSEVWRHVCSDRRTFVPGWLARVVAAWQNL